MKNSNIAVRLHEVGPRMSLELAKIQEGYNEGNVVYHAYNDKSKKEIQKTMSGIKEKRVAKEARKKEQEANVQKKEEEKLKERNDERIR